MQEPLLLPMPHIGTIRELLIEAAGEHHRLTGDIVCLNYHPGTDLHARCFIVDGMFSWEWACEPKRKHQPKLNLNVTASAEVMASMIDFLNN